MTEQEPEKVQKSAEDSDAGRAPIPSTGINETVESQPTQREQSAQTRRLEEQMSRSERGMLRWSRVMALFTIALVALTGIQTYQIEHNRPR
jgi:hypothetical protein